ncbi:hypothetical protein AAE478_008919 [Parahypoxylon ruwenzoriense]
MRDLLPPLLPPPPASFERRKRRILEQLSVPEAEYADASPKGSVDEGIRGLMDVVNGAEGWVTTSSCAGRVCVFVEGRRRKGVGGPGEGGGGDEKRGEGEEEDDDDGKTTRKLAGVGGKGGGGTWLFVSHEPVPLDGEDVEMQLGLRRSPAGEDGYGPEVPRDEGGGAVSDVDTTDATRLVHFKFEPMILHVLTASPEHAQLLLKCGLQAGFRESGAINLTPAAGAEQQQQQHVTPIVAIRSMGLGFESLVGFHRSDGRGGDSVDVECTVSSSYLRTLVRIANERFAENRKRIERFQTALAEATSAVLSKGMDGAAWEDAQVRRERKRAEGLRRREELRSRQLQQRSSVDNDDDDGVVDMGHAGRDDDVPLDADFA